MNLQSCSFVELFLSPFAIDGLSDGRLYYNNKQRVAVIVLLMKNALEATKAFKEKKFHKFDALIGNYGCQLNALKICNLARSSSFEVEVEEWSLLLTKRMEEVDALRKEIAESNKGKKRSNSSLDEKVIHLFKEKIRPLSLSLNMGYLMQAHLLTYTKVSPDNISERIEINRLNRLANGYPTFIAENMAEKAQTDLSLQCIIEVQKEGEKIASLLLSEKNRLRNMLKIVRQKKLKQNLEPHHFACQFYSMKTVLLALKEKGVLFLVKKWVKRRGDKPMIPLLFKAEKPQNPILPLDVEQVSLETPCVVFEGEVNPLIDRLELRDRIVQIGFEELMLIDTAQENQFEQNCKGLEFIEDPSALEEIKRYEKMGSILNSEKNNPNSFFWGTHVFCSTVKEEFNKGSHP